LISVGGISIFPKQANDDNLEAALFGESDDVFENGAGLAASVAGDCVVPEQVLAEPAGSSAAPPSGALAGSSGDAMPPPPPPPLVGERASGRWGGSSAASRTSALTTVHIGVGRISFYRDGRFEAQCNMPGHVGCKMTRFLPKSERGMRQGKGRPIGFLAAWLTPAIPLADKGEHRNPFFTVSLTHEARKEARAQFKLVQAGVEMIGHELQVPPGDDSEPEGSC